MLESLQKLLENQVFVGIGGATLMGALMYLARQAPKQLWTYVKATFSVSVELQNADDAFRWLVMWLAAQPYSATARRLRLTEGQGQAPSAPGEDVKKRAKFLLSPGYGVHFFFFAGTPVVLSRTMADKNGGSGDGSFRQKEEMTLTVFARSRSTLLSIINAAYELANQVESERIVVNAFDYDHWYQAATQAKRPMASVVLREGVAEAVAADLRKFIASREWYAERGIPWRRGYLFYGPPGTGKSSLVAALASEFEMSVAVMSLAGFVSDDRVVQAMRRQPEHSILLMEDIDAAITREKKEDDRVSFSAVLNALDGIAAPEGRIVVMTTNHIAKLDPALIRPGRIDLRVEIGLATADQASRMFSRYYGADGTDFGRHAEAMAPARIQELMLSSHSPIEAMRLVLEEKAA